jgi:spore germination protein KB
MKSAEQISGTQLSLLLFSFIAPTVVLVIPGFMFLFARQDAWITIFPALCIGAITIAVMLALSKRYPGLTIMQYSAHIIGRWPAKLLGCYFIFYWLNFNFVILNQHIQFINTVLLMRSPPLIVSLTLAFLCGVAIYMGIGSIARCNEFLALFIFILMIPLFLLMLGESNPAQLRPVMSNGMAPILRGSIFPGAYLSQFFILGWLLPYLNKPRHAVKISFVALLTIVCLLFITVIPLIMIFGPLTEKLSFPLLSVFQYIGLEGSFERLEAIGVVIWVMGCFVKISLTLFIICLSISQLFDSGRYRDFVLPVTVLSILGSVVVFTNYATDLNLYLKYAYPSYALITQLVVPLGLLLIDSMKRVRQTAPLQRS